MVKKYIMVRLILLKNLYLAMAGLIMITALVFIALTVWKWQKNGA